MKKSIQILNGDRTSFLNLCAFPIDPPIVAMLGSDTCRIFILFDDLLHSLGAIQPSRLPHFGSFFLKSFSSPPNLNAPAVFLGCYALAWRLF